MSFSLPSPRYIAPDRVPTLGWGIIGAGGISDSFARALRFNTSQNIVAVQSRTTSRAEALASLYGIDRVYLGLEHLLADADVDIVYIGTPHTEHAPIALAAIAAGKHVLVEKPFAESATAARAIADAARSAGVFAMEAMWTRYNPHMDVVRQVLQEGTIGRVQSIIADFGFIAPFEASNRMWDPSVGGGALLDAGVYPVSFASSILGDPENVVASGTVTSTGVDASASLLLTYSGGATAQLSTSMTALLPMQASVIGAAGRIDLPSPFFATREVTVVRHSAGGVDRATWTGTFLPQGGADLSFQALAVASYVGEGRTESPLHGLDETVAVVALLENVRDQIIADGRPAGV